MESPGATANNRKIRKPLMERKRRARINHSLNELQQLLAETEFTPKGTKLEKADILEMTVQYLRHVQQTDCDKENLENLMVERYLLGFEKCLEEVGNVPGVDLHLRRRIASHLKGCLENFCSRDKRSSSAREGPAAWTGGGTCSVVLQGSKDFSILPSKLPNGDVILFLTSNGVKCDGGLGKSEVWRPWW